MTLPETNLLNFFNKVLISLTELTQNDGTCSKDTLISHCKTVVHGGQMGEYELVIEYCKQCGLLKIKDSGVYLSSLGERFLSANPEKYFEITEAQKQLVAERIVFRGAWVNHARELFEKFSLNQTSAVYEISIIDSPITAEHNSIVHLFKHLGILLEHDYVIKVDKKYSELVYHITADGKVVSEQQLEKILMENRKLGAQAENAVVQFEKKRLNNLGKEIQSEMVKRISTINTAAGYDIESFDGTSDEIFPNRFIEVKATSGNDLRFYWSNNEMNVAKQKEKKYWIYMVKSFKESEENKICPILIQDPIKAIPNYSYLSMEAHTYIIQEIAEIDLSEHIIEDIKWQQLE